MRFKQLTLMCAIAVLGLEPIFAVSQDTTAKSPEFEAASIRPSTDKSIRGSEGGPGSESPTLYRFDRARLLDLICIAWNVDSFQVSSAAALDRGGFDLTARLPDGATKDQFRAMLQNLLADRFGLKTHIESREFPAYELVVAKSGLKLKEAVAGEAPLPTPKAATGLDWPELVPGRPTTAATLFSSGGYQVTRLRVQLEPLSMVAQFLPKQDSLPIVDKTGLTGKYSFALEYTTGMPTADSNDIPIAPDLFTALKEQLGLELVRSKLPFDVIVVESFYKMPTEN
jgi:uncharacterized protein (TIGR03435 family)